MIVIEFLLNIFFYCFAFCFMRFYFWLIEPKIYKKSKEKVIKNKFLRLLGLHYFYVNKNNKLYIIIYSLFILLFVFSFIMFLIEYFIQSDLIVMISNISGKILWYYFCIVGITYWFVLKMNSRKK